MEKMEIKNLKVNYLSLKILGVGKLGICFLMPNNKVLKLFITPWRIRELYHFFPDLEKHFEEINAIGNEAFMVPEVLLIGDGKVKGYIAGYSRGKRLANMPLNTPISKIIDAYKVFINNTKRVSDGQFELRDIHDYNILYDEVNNRFSCIDLDHGIKSSLDSSATMRVNMRAINACVICSLFGVDSVKKELEFNDYDLDKIYLKAIRRDYEAIFDFFAYIQTMMNDENVTRGTLRHEKRKILEVRTIVDYYNRIL